MKVYTIYSESHREMYEMFNNSIHTLNPDLEIMADFINQDCPSGQYMSKGWVNTMARKLDCILHAIDANDTFIHSDVDIIFQKGVKDALLEELGDHDIAFQKDSKSKGASGNLQEWYCMGFFVCRPNARIKELFLKIKNTLDEFEGNDQMALNHYIGGYKNDNPGHGWNDIKYKHLSDSFYTFGLSPECTGMPWEGQEFYIPENTYTFHANWTLGTDNKLRLMRYAKDKLSVGI